MHALYLLRAFGGIFVRQRYRGAAREFLAHTSSCRAVQQETLQDILQLNADSDLSRQHNLDGSCTIEDFQSRFPVTEYDFFQPYIERVKQGETQALLGPENQLLMFTLSSGTTTDSKFIPITVPFLKSYRQGWQNWGILTYDDYPSLKYHNIVQLTSNYDKFRTPGGAPCGNISGLIAAMQSPVVQSMYTVPGEVSRIDDAQLKYYTTLRLALADRYVGMLTTANPSTLLHLARFADQEKESLVRDIADGRLTGAAQMDPRVLGKLKRRLQRKNRRRARELEQIIERTGHLYPRDYWPGLCVLAVWTGGSAGAYLSQLKPYYGDLPVRDHGLSASEGRMTIPLASGTSSGVLDITSHFFEFVPEAEDPLTTDNILTADQLEEGQNYYILLTTPSGLYRYHICDVVRCTGFYQSTPMLEFLHKGAHISNLTGEKITESQVVTAVRGATDEVALELGQFTVIPHWGEPPRYQLLFEESPTLFAESLTQLLAAFDQRLQEANCEYAEKRQSGRLAPPVPCPLKPGTWQRFATERQQKPGGSLEQYKHPCLIPKLDYASELIEKFSH
ncbi:GH3 auxin-responsive promoter [Gimesia panareensis]|uniref:GH3 auxin-responsive promoter n=1 Tax=Gimesia panareensis TaxID=2527978 RepID=A0A518FGU8_9PLAN|nr:GH3 auxin-responsive promoter family protein [Gimesia panareensis]QDV15566.1 GH3 auxin-responsive promoter [Gimesia panareensis]